MALSVLIPCYFSFTQHVLLKIKFCKIAIYREISRHGLIVLQLNSYTDVLPFLYSKL